MVSSLQDQSSRSFSNIPWSRLTGSMLFPVVDMHKSSSQSSAHLSYFKSATYVCRSSVQTIAHPVTVSLARQYRHPKLPHIPWPYVECDNDLQAHLLFQVSDWNFSRSLSGTTWHSCLPIVCLYWYNPSYLSNITSLVLAGLLGDVNCSVYVGLSLLLMKGDFERCLRRLVCTNFVQYLVLQVTIDRTFWGFLTSWEWVRGLGLDPPKMIR